MQRRDPPCPGCWSCARPQGAGGAGRRSVGCSCPTEGPSAHPGLSEGDREVRPPLTLSHCSWGMLPVALLVPSGCVPSWGKPSGFPGCKSALPIKGVDN